MKKLMVMLMLAGVGTLLCPSGIMPVVIGQVAVEVREADGQTPFDGRDIIVGTKLTIVVSSDSNDYFSGGLFIAGEDRALATLTGRDYDPNIILYDPNSSLYGITQFIGDWTGSHYPAAGDFAKVIDWEDSQIAGFDLYTSYPYPTDDCFNSNCTVAGDWFIIDYEANQVGDCNVGFYNYNISWETSIYYISFSHIADPDLYPDQIVNFSDFVMFASQWNATNCADPNWCNGADLSRDGDVDLDDLMLFAQYWLWSFEL